MSRAVFAVNGNNAFSLFFCVHKYRGERLDLHGEILFSSTTVRIYLFKFNFESRAVDFVIRRMLGDNSRDGVHP